MTNRISDVLQRMGRLGDGLPGAANDRLETLDGFGADPGNLGARIYLPPGLPRHAPLVVVLHGCTQTAAGYDHGSGWSRLADLGGFALLLPEQRRENNPNLCFNWFVPDDIRRDSGEAGSIAEMVGAMADRYAIDRGRIHVTGLSAGGAMAAAMLATYPDLFAGGAVIAGLPYACAANVPQALKRMRGEGLPDTDALADRLRQASGREGRWPTLSVWHGTADSTVDPSNAEALLSQWRSVQGLGDLPDSVENDPSFTRSVWRDAKGREAVEFFEIPGMGHGAPLKTSGPESCGAAGPFMLDVGVSSTCRIARSWGLVEVPEIVAAPEPARPSWDGAATPWSADFRSEGLTGHGAGPGAGVGEVIENALRKAGLLR